MQKTLQKLQLHPIAVVRKSQKLNQEAFAREIGFSQSLISLIERGARPITIEVAKAIAEKYQLDVAPLMGAGNLPALLTGSSSSTYPMELPFLTTKANQELITNYLADIHEYSNVYVLSEVGITYKDSVIVDNGTRYVGNIVAPDDYKYATGLVAVIYSWNFTVLRIKNNDLASNKTLTLHSENNTGAAFVLNQEDIKKMVKLNKIVWADVD